MALGSASELRATNKLTAYNTVFSVKLIVRSASQEVPRSLRNPKVHYHVHQSSPMVPILSQLNLIHALRSYFLNIHFNIILPSTPTSSGVLFSLGFLIDIFSSHRSVYNHLLVPCHPWSIWPPVLPVYLTYSANSLDSVFKEPGVLPLRFFIFGNNKHLIN
jgi:hypothetical protein